MNFKIQIKRLWRHPICVAMCNVLLVMLLFSLCRIFFFLLNRTAFSGMTWPHFAEILGGGLRFDLSAILLFNSLYILLTLLPFRFRQNAHYQEVAKWVFVIINAILLIANCADMAYFPFSQRRTTCAIFSEFAHDNNLPKIFAISLVNYWYITLFCVATIAVLWFGYRRFSVQTFFRRWSFYVLNTLILLTTIYFVVIGIRGGFGAYTRPINISNTAQYIERPIENALVLNTPFSLFTTVERRGFDNPNWFDSDELETIFSPIRKPKTEAEFRPLNVVVLILESFGKEYVGYFNRNKKNADFQTFTPFLDSLLAQSCVFENAFANGRKSIDAMPSTLSSIPMFIEPYITTPYATNAVSSLADVLKNEGYYSAFFHGAPNGSMGFQAYANAAGYNDYFGMDNYGNSTDFDGIWAIWDEEFMQYFCQKMGEFRQPFHTTLFTASSHHPFAVPKRYEGVFPKGTLPIHQCIGYTDHALRQFFESAKRQPWYENTLFVLVADHTNVSDVAEYQTDKGVFEIPIAFYRPTASDLPKSCQKVMSQNDVMPTILGYLNYQKPYFAFGNDVLNDSTHNRVVNYHCGSYQLFDDSLMIQFDGQRVTAIYDYKNDELLQKNLCDSFDVSANERYLKAVVQQYIQRMIADELTVK